MHARIDELHGLIAQRLETEGVHAAVYGFRLV
jgi:hypothetical protein